MSILSWTVALLGDDQGIGDDRANLTLISVLIFFGVGRCNKRPHPRPAQSRLTRADCAGPVHCVFAGLLGATVQLGEDDDGNLEFLGSALMPREISATSFDGCPCLGRFGTQKLR